MRLWLDAESNGFLGELISMALVAEDGQEWYEALQYPQRMYDSWAEDHILPVLGKEPLEEAQELSESLQNFLKQFDKVHIVADWPGDICHFCRAMFLDIDAGSLIGHPHITFEIDRKLPNTKDISRIPHNSLEDARAIRRFVLKKSDKD